MCEVFVEFTQSMPETLRVFVRYFTVLNPKGMQAEIITIGDEILIGQTVDTNSAWMGSRLNEVGIDVHMIRSIRDRGDAIVEALNSVHPDSAIVLITGGLGPTKDDITKHVLTRYFGGQLVYRPEVFEHIRRLFARFDREPNEMNRSQAELPDVCEPLFNPNGTASGMRFEKDGRYYISMPGVPYEMKGIMEGEVLPWVRSHFSCPPIVHHTLLTHGVPESELASVLSEWEERLPSPLRLAYLPSPGMVKLRLSAAGGDTDENRSLIRREFTAARELLGDSVFGENADTLEEVVGKLLNEHGATVSTAESCTGGTIASRLTSIPGSSAYFLGSVVSYADAVKVQQLGVNEADILVHGAVSETVVLQMAKGARKRLQTDYSIATSGVAGPDGGTEEKPVGTVWIAVSGPNGSYAAKYQFGANRSRNIKRSVLMGLDMLRRQVLEDQKQQV